MKPVLFDTDIGSDCDDAVALALIVACPEVLELAAVTTVSSDTAIRARVAASLLALAGRDDVDVCAGARGGLAQPPERYNWFGHEAECIADATCRVSTEPAAERIVRAAREQPGLEIVMAGPLTNLAHALALDPELPSRVARVTIMGGHIREAKLGSYVCPFGVDYNLGSDPEAAVSVLGAGFSTTLVTADVTLQTWLRTADVDRLRAGDVVARELARQIDFWSPVQRALFTSMGGEIADDNESFLHDPLTVLALIDPESLKFETLSIVPTIEQGVQRTHEVPSEVSMGSEMRVATAVAAAAARDAIVERLLRL